MSKEEYLSHEIGLIISALTTCQKYIEEGNYFEAEVWFKSTLSSARVCKRRISEYADEQEKELGEEEEAKGYEVTNEKQ